ncbi:MAG: response regulator [Defluviitaleaceae bacterium]|nr:response regulator [Defluviitaleaceae bacterium]
MSVSNRGREVVFVVDDAKLSQEFAKKCLSDDYIVHTESSGKDLFSLLDVVMPDLILLDAVMPELDGYAVNKLLKENEKTQNIPVIFLTAANNPKSEAKALSEGAVDYITKPFSSEILRMRVGLHLLLQRQKREMQSAVKSAEVANNAKSAFITIMSHEMRTPLSSIIGFSDLSLESEDLSDELYSNLTNIKNAGTTLLHIISDVLDISKIESGNLEIMPVEYDTASMINDSINQSILHRGEKPITFKLEIAPDFPAKLFGDDLRVKQILNNLLSNAFKYTKEGSVCLSIDHTANGTAAWVTITVADTGVGISDADTEVIFNDYVQTNMTANRKVTGTGLGLPISRKLARMMDGDIMATGEIGKGSTFAAWFWQQKVSGETLGEDVINNLNCFLYPEKRQPRKENIKLPSVRILVVDDVPANLVLIAGLLKRYDIKTTCVESGFEAIEAIKSERLRFDAIFLDHMMPDMDGIETLRRIREIETEYAQNIPIIAFTANALVGNDEMFFLHGFQDYIPKPIEISTLDAVIKKWTKSVSLLSYRVFGIDFDKGIARFGGDESSYIDVLRTFAKTTPAMLDKAESWDDLTQYMTIVHGIKGSCYGIFAEKTGALAEALEAAAKTERVNFIAANNITFLQSTRGLITGISAVLADLDAATHKEKKAEPDAKLLARIHDACNRRDMIECDELISALCEYEYETDGELVMWLREMADEMEYAQIAERLSVKDA